METTRSPPEPYGCEPEKYLVWSPNREQGARNKEPATSTDKGCEPARANQLRLCRLCRKRRYSLLNELSLLVISSGLTLDDLRMVLSTRTVHTTRTPWGSCSSTAK
jgi:hypothetical protein